MRRSVLLGAQALRGTPVRLCDIPRSPKEEKEQMEKKQAEALRRGYASRDSVQDKIYMDKTFERPESLGDGVVVANLPAKPRESTEFDQYQRSTTDFTSLVTPHGVTGVGLGAGFGAKEDKRLGFLRPRKAIQPHSGSSTVIPKYDENGMPVDDTLSRDQILKKRLEYMKSFEGMTMSHNEHFLLVDLDFEKDAILFGNTREDFERNVTKMKNVITGYNKWERTDNFYYYSTIALKLLTLWVLMECLHQYYELRLFMTHYESFVEVMEDEMATLSERRKRDLEAAAVEVKYNKPNFKPIVAAMESEKRRVTAEKQSASATAVQASASQSPDDVAAVLSSSLSPALAAAAIKATTTTTAATSAPADTPQARGDHPMDTTGEARQQREQLAKQQLEQMTKLHRDASQTHDSLLGRLKGWLGLGPKVLLDDDLSLYSYAASPTSIETIRSVRRRLLPRSEDYTQVVREEMLEYKRAKDLKVSFPG